MKNAQTIIINGQAISGDIATLRAILGITEENVVEAHKAETPKAKAPKAPKAKAPKDETPKAEEPKAEEPKAEYSYTKGGAVIQYADHHTLKANHLRRVNNAISRLEEVGFVVAWKRIGGWIHIYHYAKKDNMTRAEFEAALGLLPQGWELHYGSKGKVSIVDKNMLADYADSFMA